MTFLKMLEQVAHGGGAGGTMGGFSGSAKTAAPPAKMGHPGGHHGGKHHKGKHKKRRGFAYWYGYHKNQCPDGKERDPDTGFCKDKKK